MSIFQVMKLSFNTHFALKVCIILNAYFTSIWLLTTYSTNPVISVHLGCFHFIINILAQKPFSQLNTSTGQIYRSGINESTEKNNFKTSAAYVH